MWEKLRVGTAALGCPPGATRQVATMLSASRWPCRPNPLSFRALESPPQCPAPAPAHGGHLQAIRRALCALEPHAEMPSCLHAAVLQKRLEALSPHSTDSATVFPKSDLVPPLRRAFPADHSRAK